MANYKAKYISGDPNAITFELYRDNILINKYVDASQGSGFIPSYTYEPETKQIYIESNSYFYDGFGVWGREGTKYSLPVNDIEKNVKINIEGYTFPPVSTPPAAPATKPTGEIKKFIDIVNSELNTVISALESKKTEIKKVYDEAIKITSLKTTKWPLLPPQYTESDPNVKTIGDLFKASFNIETGEVRKPHSHIYGQSLNPDYMDWVSDLNGKSTGDTTINDKYDFLNKNMRTITNLSSLNHWNKPSDDIKSRIENPDLYSPGQLWFDTFMYMFLDVLTNDQERVKNVIFESDIYPNSINAMDIATISVSSFTPDGNRVYLGTYSDSDGITRNSYEPKPGYSDFDLLSTADELKILTYVPFSISEGYSGVTGSFQSLLTQYKSGLLSDLKNDPIFERVRGKAHSNNPSIPIGQFVGNFESILLYKAFIEAGDKYKQIHLPYKQLPKKEEAVAPPPPPETISASQSGASQSTDKKYIFNVETDGKFVNKELGSFTVIPPLNDVEKVFIFTEEENILDDEYVEISIDGVGEDLFTPDEFAHEELLAKEDAKILASTEGKKEKEEGKKEDSISIPISSLFTPTNAKIPPGFNDVPLYHQSDKRWSDKLYNRLKTKLCADQSSSGKTVGSSGCGPSAITMVINYWASKGKCNPVTPDVICQFFMDFGGRVCEHGTGLAQVNLDKFKETFGVVMQIGLTDKKVMAALNKGYPCVIAGEGYYGYNFNGAHNSTGDKPGTGPQSYNGGHFLCLTGIDSEGRIRVNDSGSNPSRGGAITAFGPGKTTTNFAKACTQRAVIYPVDISSPV